MLISVHAKLQRACILIEVHTQDHSMLPYITQGITDIYWGKEPPSRGYKSLNSSEQL